MKQIAAATGTASCCYTVTKLGNNTAVGKRFICFIRSIVELFAVKLGHHCFAFLSPKDTHESLYSLLKKNMGSYVRLNNFVDTLSSIERKSDDFYLSIHESADEMSGHHVCFRKNHN